MKCTLTGLLRNARNRSTRSARFDREIPLDAFVAHPGTAPGIDRGAGQARYFPFFPGHVDRPAIFPKLSWKFVRKRSGSDTISPQKGIPQKGFSATADWV